MRAPLVKTVTITAILAVSLPCLARVNPLKVITERRIRPEIVIVLDTSGSMAFYPSPEDKVGTDCSGDRKGSVDLCGDGICTGSEGSSSNLCASDCNISSHENYNAGSPPLCNTAKVKVSRMFMVKRVLRNLLPELRKSASLGLVTFKQTGYYSYYPALDPSFTTYNEKKVSIFLTRTEMKRRGAWNSDLNTPRGTFTWNGTDFALLSQASMDQDEDSLYARTDNVGIENRFRFSSAGLAYSDGNKSWRYQGSYYTYVQVPVDYKAKPTVFDKYHGPQFKDDSGQLWVYHRYNGDWTSQEITGNPSGMLAEGLSAYPSQDAVDEVFGRILGRLNYASNGGLWAWGGTPTGPAINIAKGHFYDRQAGQQDYAEAGPDPASACRGRYVLLLTDGGSNQGVETYKAAEGLFKFPQFANNPVKTLVIGLPGLPSKSVEELDLTADMGDDGIKNNSKTALYASDETSLIKVVREAFLEMLQGDYTTTAPGLSTSGTAYVVNDLALLPSTEYPKWRGHFRAMDLTQNPAVEKWDAAKVLNATPYNKRRLYTGYHNTNNGDPVALFGDDGNVDVEKVKEVWAMAGTPPSDNEIRIVVEWLAGKDQAWKLGPVFRSAPATVGPPPHYNVAGHHNFRSQYAAREPLIYITSNGGILHAFRAKDGSEAFGYVPPTLWPRIFNLWKQGGQDPEPDLFQWLLAASPRVEDIPPSVAPGSWRTHLMLSMGPRGDSFVALDITDPSSCTAVKCEAKDPPFTVAAHSSGLSMGGTMGETWSTPAYYYNDVTPSSARAEVAMGSGYGAGNSGSYYNRLQKIYGDNTTAMHPGSGATVDYAVLADTAAAVDMEAGRRVIGTYQGDLNGRVVRYNEGNPGEGKAVISDGAASPFYYSPALLHRGNDKVIMAAAAGSDREEQPAPNTESTLYIRSESKGDVSATSDQMTCKVSEICSGNGGCPATVPSGCSAPSSKAAPTGSPLLFNNSPSPGSSQVEAFYLLFDPPQSICANGDTWLIRVATRGETQEVISSTKFAGVRATGMTVVGGGLDLAIATVGKGKEEATVFTVSDAINTQAGVGQPPIVEVWREVRGNVQ